MKPPSAHRAHLVRAWQEGATQTDSGLVVKTLTEGDGASPTASDTVEVHYEGKLIDGTVFDSSYKRGESISFPLSGVIAGWTEGLQLMKPGTLLLIPSCRFSPRHPRPWHSCENADALARA